MLYHYEVFMPRRIAKSLPTNVRKLTYSNHAVNESRSDRYGDFELPKELRFSDCDLIEAEVYASGIEKVVVRFNIDAERSLCLAIKPATNFVKTVWINLSSDKHNTLDRSRYVSKN